MDYLSVTQTAYFTAAALNGVVAFLLYTQARKYALLNFYALGFSVQTVWLIGIWLSYSDFLVSSQFGLIAEILRYCAWFVVFLLLLNHHSHYRSWPLLVWLPVALIFSLSALCLILLTTGMGSTHLISLSFAGLAGLLIIFVEQVTRNQSTRRLTKLIGLALTGQFLLDAYLYGQMSFNSSLAIGIWQARAGVSFITALAIALGAILFSDHRRPSSLSVSSPVIFYSSSALVVIVIAVLAGIGALYVQEMGGFLGSYLFLLALISALFVITALLISKRARQNIEVFISKHFFNLKYDYREQWLETIAFTNEHSPSEQRFNDATLQHIQQTFGSPSGVLWMVSQGQLRPVSATGSLTESPAFEINEEFIKTMVTHGWIYAPLSKGGTIAENNEKLPAWFKQRRIWMLSPMISRMKLIGMVAISRPRSDSTVTFEDRDLLTNMTNQISNQILLHQQEQMIGESKQLDTYNRLSAFIMHDVNNVIAQLALINRNAEKHRNNPAFIDDMIKTVNNSVERMQSLVHKFRPDSTDRTEDLDISSLLSELTDVCADKTPKPAFHEHQGFNVTADRQKLYFALKNFIRNAQEATPADGTLSIASKTTNHGHRVIEITDTGSGMTADFIQNQLFAPFSSTKDEQGMGLGAHLSKSYLEQIGAQVNVTSEPGLGSQFEIVWS